MVKSITEISIKEENTDLELINGWMAQLLKVGTPMIKSKGMGSLEALIIRFSKESGKMVREKEEGY